MLGSLAANRAVTLSGTTTAYVAGGPSGPPATRLFDDRDTTPLRAHSGNSRDGTPVDDVRVETVRQQRLARSLILGGGAALVIAGSGLLLVGVRRRLW